MIITASTPVAANTTGVLIRDAIVNDVFYDVGTTFRVLTDPIVDPQDGVVFQRVEVGDLCDSWFLAEDIAAFDAEAPTSSPARTYRVLTTATVTFEQDVVAGTAAEAQEAVERMGLDRLDGLTVVESKNRAVSAATINLDA